MQISLVSAGGGPPRVVLLGDSAINPHLLQPARQGCWEGEEWNGVRNHYRYFQPLRYFQLKQIVVIPCVTVGHAGYEQVMIMTQNVKARLDWS